MNEWGVANGWKTDERMRTANGWKTDERMRTANGWKTDERMRTRASVHPLQYPLTALNDISFADGGYGLTLKLCHADLVQPNALHALARQ
jgi:hypothetical protein